MSETRSPQNAVSLRVFEDLANAILRHDCRCAGKLHGCREITEIREAARAALIEIRDTRAAAPDLLEAAREVLAERDGALGPDSVGVLLLRAAIARAEGGNDV